jgi:hypothetical protein
LNISLDKADNSEKAVEIHYPKLSPCLIPILNKVSNKQTLFLVVGFDVPFPTIITVEKFADNQRILDSFLESNLVKHYQLFVRKELFHV